MKIKFQPECQLMINNLNLKLRVQMKSFHLKRKNNPTRSLQQSNPKEQDKLLSKINKKLPREKEIKNKNKKRKLS